VNSEAFTPEPRSTFAVWSETAHSVQHGTPQASEKNPRVRLLCLLSM